MKPPCHVISLCCPRLVELPTKKPNLQDPCSITNSWVGYLSCFGQNLTYGGPQVVIFALLVATFAQGAITLGLSELASAFPSSGVSASSLMLFCSQPSQDSNCPCLGSISLRLHRGAGQDKTLRILYRGLDLRCWLVDRDCFGCFSCCNLHLWHGSILARRLCK
jgi:hypothetical protein